MLLIIIYFWLLVPGGCSVDVDTVYTIDWPSASINTTVFQSCGDVNVIGKYIKHNYN